ncbi:hypothetical protein FJZ31_38795 [Candidatus Poribacteria bacterium]|nr:hypothetical protein [Candidatus Poribacteria bacterium]
MGDVCGYLTVECGTSADITEQVQQAIAILAPGGGFILSPVTNVRADTERAWQNIKTLIETWRTLREYSVSLSQHVEKPVEIEDGRNLS